MGLSLTKHFSLHVLSHKLHLTVFLGFISVLAHFSDDTIFLCSLFPDISGMVETISEINSNCLFSAITNLFCSLQTKTNLGEILFSLSYMPTAERMSVVLMKARGLNPPFSDWNTESRPISKYIEIFCMFL